MSPLGPFRWLLGIGITGALWLGYGAWEGHQQAVGEARATQRYNAAIEALKADAARLLAAQTAKVTAREQALQDLKNQQEVQDGKNQRTIEDLGRRLGGCATPTRPDVGAVVVAPQVKLPPLPAIVQLTEPKPAGYFQKSLADYSSGLPGRPTPSTQPTQAAEPMRRP